MNNQNDRHFLSVLNYVQKVNETRITNDKNKLWKFEEKKILKKDIYTDPVKNGHRDKHCWV